MYMKYAFQWYITLRHWQILHFYQTFGVFFYQSGLVLGGCNSLKWGEIVFFLIFHVLIHKCFKKMVFTRIRRYDQKNAFYLVKTVFHTQKSLLFDKSMFGLKNKSDFDGTMSSFERTDVCRLVASFFSSSLTKKKELIILVCIETVMFWKHIPGWLHKK